MLEFLTYELKVAVLIAVFYMFYRLLLARETFHRVNRIVLLLTAVTSFILPLCVITMHETVMMPTPRIGVELGTAVAADLPLGSTATPVGESNVRMDVQSVILILYVIGVVATLAHTFWSIVRILTLIRKSERHPQPDGTTICVTGNADLAPFSWMHYIVMNRSDYETCDAAILAHERGHIRFHHSWDVFLVDFLTALQWFNPAIWMLRSDLRAIHEYEADGAVLSQGINARQYQYLLVTKAGGIGGYSLANGITHSALKNRITMMLHKKSSRRSYWKLLVLLPIIGITLALNAETVTDYVYDQPQKPVPVKKGKKNATIKTDGNQTIQVVEAEAPKEAEAFTAQGIFEPDPETITAQGVFEPEPEKVYDVVEEMPVFPGGTAAMMTYLSQNIHYPTEAHAAGIQGRVIVSFIVEKDGSINNAQVVKPVGSQLDAEALRVVNSMPAWTPGKQNGKAVRVKYTIPITFRLDKKEEPKEITGSATPVAQGTFTPAVRGTVYPFSGMEDIYVEVDGKKIDNPENEEWLTRIKTDDIQSIQIFRKDADHPMNRVYITLKKK